MHEPLRYTLCRNSLSSTVSTSQTSPRSITMALTFRAIILISCVLIAACDQAQPSTRAAPQIAPMLVVHTPAAAVDPAYASIDLPRRTEWSVERPAPVDQEEAEGALVAAVDVESTALTTVTSDAFDARVLSSGLDAATNPTASDPVGSKPAPAEIPAASNPAMPTPAFVVDQFLGEPFVPGTLSQRFWQAGQDFHGTEIPTPVLVATGTEAGPTLCLTGAIHGDELNGIKAVHSVMYATEPKKLKGRIIGVPIVNLSGFQRQSRYLADRRDLNRFFPGNPRGSSAARMAFSFFREVILHCDALVDLHTGSFYRSNLPQIRGDLKNEAVLKLTRGFGSTAVMHGAGARGTLRYAATAAGIPAVTLEAGEPLRVDDDAVADSVRAINALIHALGMTKKRTRVGNPEPVYYTSTWLRADGGGILSSQTKLGEKVKAGELLGTVTDPITNKMTEVRSPKDGRILGMAVNQFVIPGFAVYHLGLPVPRGDVDLLPLEDEADILDEDSDQMRQEDYLNAAGNRANQGIPESPSEVPAATAPASSVANDEPADWDADGQEPLPPIQDRMNDTERNE
jgi:uncharacterized protein